MADFEIVEDRHLATYATRSGLSRGRLHADHDAPYRGLYQRDRDRIVHSAAFRRLQYKTQVFVSVMEGDYFRNRLTHTLEVTQIARTIARALDLNEDLTEALALAHDLGHGPFGHSGESALDEMMKGRGGFDHNAQGLRVVDFLEQRYPRFPGLNLTYETREGYVKNYVRDGRPGHPRKQLGFAGDEMPSLEVQLVGHADEIAYDTHDLDDGLVSGALDENKVRTVSLWQQVEKQVVTEYPQFSSDHRMRWRAVVRRLIATLVTDLLEETRRRIEKHKVKTLEDVRRCEDELIGFSPEIAPRKLQLEEFLMQNFYHSPQVRQHTSLWQERVKQLFQAYLSDPRKLPAEQRNLAEAGKDSLERVICDYLAGMTDRYARKQWDEIVGKP
jgi:dGTPase